MGSVCVTPLLIMTFVTSLLITPASSDTGFLCSRYVAACRTFLATVGCTSSVVEVCGGDPGPTMGGPGTLANHDGDNGAGARCTCLEPFYFATPSARIGELLWDAAVKSSVPALQLSQPPAVGRAPPLNAPASFAAVCAAGLARLGCPAASASIVPPPGTLVDAAAAAYVCECGVFQSGNHRALEGLIDALAAPAGTPAVPPATPNFVCGGGVDRFTRLCADVLYGLSCTSLTVSGCGAAGNLSSFVGDCSCTSPLPLGEGGVTSSRVRELLIDSRVAAAASTILGAAPALAGAAPGATVDFPRAYTLACIEAMAQLGCAAGAVVVDTFSPGGVDTSSCKCGAAAGADGGLGLDATGRIGENLVDAILEQFMENATAEAAALFGPSPTPAPKPGASLPPPRETMDVYTSVVALLAVGWCVSALSELLRLPSRVPFLIFAGIALYPSLHPALTGAPSTVVSPEDETLLSPGSIAPVNAIRSFCLLIALARGGMSVKLHVLRKFGLVLALLVTLPYAAELLTEAAVAPLLLPAWYGAATPGGAPPPLVALASASVWAPLSPSLVIPNMMHVIELGHSYTASIMLAAAPFEASVALVTESVMVGCLEAIAADSSTSVVLGHIVTYVLGSILYGIAFALAFWGLHRARHDARVVGAIGNPEVGEVKLLFFVVYILCFSTSEAPVPWLVGYYCAIVYAISVQYLLPDLANALVVDLKTVWYFCETFLFVLTGCIVRPAIDSGLAKDLFANMLGVLICGTLARMAADVLCGALWHAIVAKRLLLHFDAADWRAVADRTAFLWIASMPKATLQATLSPQVANALSATLAGSALPCSPENTAACLAFPASVFIAPASAISILYLGSVGTLLTRSVGVALASHLEHSAREDGEAVPAAVLPRDLEEPPPPAVFTAATSAAAIARVPRDGDDDANKAAPLHALRAAALWGSNNPLRAKAVRASSARSVTAEEKTRSWR